MKKKLFFSILIFLMGAIYFSTGIKTIAEGSMYFKGNYFSSIREEIALNDKTYLAVSTDSNLYLLENQVIKFEYNLNQEAIFIEALNDLNGNGYDELLIITNAKNQDNILLFDTNSGEPIYSYASKMRAYNVSSNNHKPTGYYDEYVVVEDYLIHDNQFYGIAGYNAFMLDLKNQKEIWQIEAKDNLWDIEKIGDINHDNVEDVVVSLQTTDIIAFSGSDGDIIYQKNISEPLIDRHDRPIPSSIWNMQYDEETHILYAASENGKVYKIDSKNGNVLEKEILSSINFERGYNSPSFRDIKFKGYSVELINDITGDGVKDLIYYEMTHPYRYNMDLYDNNEDISIQFIDGESLKVLDEKIELSEDNYGFRYMRGTYHEEEVFYVFDKVSQIEIENSSESYAIYKIFSINQNTYLDDELKIKNQGVFGHFVLFSFLELESTEIVVFSNQNISFINNDEILKTIAMIKAENYILDGNRMLLLQGGYADRGYYNLNMISLETDESLWDYQLMNEDFSEYTQIDFSSDFNQDNIKDVVVVNTGRDNKEIPWVMLIDGKTGQKVSKVSIAIQETDITDFSDSPSFDVYLQELGYYTTYLMSYGIYNDVNQDGVNEYYVTNDLGELYIINFSDNELFDYFSPNGDIEYKSQSHYVEISFTNTKKVSDIDGDLHDDFIQIKSENGETVLKLIKTDHFQLSTEIIKHFPLSNFTISSNLGDIDEDGINDVTFTIVNRNYDGINDVTFTIDNRIQTSYYIVSSKTGKVITSIPFSSEDYFYLSDEDINGDQLKEVYHVKYDRDKREHSVLLYDVSQETPQVLFTSPSYNPYNFSSINTPAVTFKDEDKYYIALHTGTSYSHSIISVYDLANGALVDNIRIQTEKERTDIREEYSLGSIAVIKDGDDIYFYQVLKYNYDDYGRAYQGEDFVYNYSDRVLSLYYTKGAINQIDIIDQEMILQDVYGQVIKTNLIEHIKFNNLQENQTINKNIDLTFRDKQEGNVYIYVDHELVGITDKNHYNLKLLEGKHVISISQITPNGIETMDTLHVVVTKNYAYMIVVMVSTFILFASAIILPRRKKRYPLPMDLEGSDK